MQNFLQECVGYVYMYYQIENDQLHYMFVYCENGINSTFFNRL